MSDIYYQLANDLYYMGSTIAALIATVAGAIGILFCFQGFKLVKIWFAILGALLGFVLVGNLGMAFIDYKAAIPCGIIGAIVFAVLLFKLYKLGVFINNFTVFTLLSFLLMGDTSETTIAISCVLGLLVGLLAVWWVRPSIVISTAVMGGFMAGCAIPLILSMPNLVLSFVLFVGLSIWGGMYQWKHTAKDVKASKKTKAPNGGAPVAPNAPINTPQSPEDIIMSAPSYVPISESKAVVSEATPVGGNGNETTDKVKETADKVKDEAKKAAGTLKEKVVLFMATVKQVVVKAKNIQDNAPIGAKDGKTLLGYTAFAADPKRTGLLFLAPLGFAILFMVIPSDFLRKLLTITMGAYAGLVATKHSSLVGTALTLTYTILSAVMLAGMYGNSHVFASVFGQGLVVALLVLAIGVLCRYFSKFNEHIAVYAIGSLATVGVSACLSGNSWFYGIDISVLLWTALFMFLFNEILYPCKKGAKVHQ